MPKNPTDPANIITEEILSATEEEISAIYAEAHAEMVEKLLNFLFTIDDINDARQIYKFFRMKNKMKMEALKAGKISKKEYNAWKAKAIMAEKSWLPVQKTLAEDLTRSRQIAASIINDKKCDVYALNYNYATYEIEKGIGASTSFALYDHDTVERLIAKKPNLLPNYKVNDAKDLVWNTKHIRNAVTQGILQGESNQDIAKRMQKVCDMSENASIRTARTATTCAQNSGRIDGYKRAQEMGIDVEQIWVSTLDGRTRHEHRVLMGQRREIGKPFEVDGYKIMFPGDPNASAFLVYNCRCTLIADVGGSEYNLEERIEENLKKKGMTWDEWVNEQPLPKHYGETKKDYLKRYKEHHKKMKFSDWLEEQAMPDILITKAWSDKKMSNIYNMIKEQNVTDANKFYKELGKLGKPSEVWDKYLTGQLDAIDLKQFEEILKKYLPKETTPAATKAVKTETKAVKETTAETVDFEEFKKALPQHWSNLSDQLQKELKDAGLFGKYAIWIDGTKDFPELDEFFKKYQQQISKKITDLESQIKYIKSDPMSFDDADMHHVNPGYKGNNGGIYAKNCQTCAMTYEARRQGYDVVALGKDKTHSHTYALQTEVGIDQANAWINKLTGEMPVHLECSHKLQTPGKYKWLEDTVGHNGERYTLSVHWKSGGAHVINMDRDANGVLRLIDNQRGPNEKHIWTGEKEIKQYLDKVGYIKYALRVDDCIPNPKYFNMITKEAKTVSTTKAAKETKTVNTVKNKSNLPKDLDDLTMGNYFSQDKIEKVYDHLMEVSKKLKFKYDEEIYDYYEKYVSGKIKDPELDNIFGIVSDKPIKNEIVLDKSLFKNKKMSAVYTDIKKTDVKTANQFYKELQKMGKPSNVWDKYLKGQLSDVDVQKIEKHLAKKYSALEEAMPGESVTGLDIDALSKKKVTGVYNDFVTDGDKTTANKFYNELKKIATTKGYKSQSDVWKKYLNGELDFDDIEKIDKYVIKKYQATVSTPGIEQTVMTKADLPNNPLELNHDKFGTLNDYVVNHYNKIYTAAADWIDYYKKYKKGEIIDPELDKILLGKKSVTKADLPDDWKELYNSLDKDNIDKLVSAFMKNANNTDSLAEYYLKWKNGKINDQVYDETLLGIKPGSAIKIDYDNLPLTPIDMYDKLWDIDKNAAKKFSALFTDLSKKPEHYGFTKQDLWDMYKKQTLNAEDIKKIDEFVEKVDKYTAKSTSSTITMTDELKEVIIYFTNEVKDKTLADEIWDLVDNKLTIKYALKTNDVWSKYWKGEINEPDLDKLIKKTGVEPPKFKPAGTTVVDKSKLGKKVTAAYNKIKDEIGTSDANKFYNELKKIGKEHGNYKQSDIWIKYLHGDLNAEDVAKIEKHLIKVKDYTKVEEPIVPVVDIDAIKNKKMSQFYNELKAENTSNANKFYNELKKHGKPSEVWTEYIKGELPEDATKKIDEYVIKKYSKGVKASAAQKQTLKDQVVKTADNIDIYDLKKLAADDKDLYDEVFSVLHEMKGSPGTNWKKYLIGKLNDPELDKILVKHNLASDDIVKKVEQQKELDAAKEELEKAKTALPENKKYSGIWKDEVSLSDYTTKKSTLAAKKVYFEDELQKAKDLKNQNPHQPGTSQYEGYIKWNESQIEKFEKLLKSIDEFEQLGKEYEKAYKAVEEAQKKVNDLIPTGFTPDAYTKERRDAALWAKDTKEADNLLRDRCGEVWRGASSVEKDAIFEYTQSYSKFNEPLRGIEYFGSYKGVGKTDLNAKHANNGKYLNAMTDIIEKSTYDHDFWFQRGVSFRGMDKFFNIDMDILQYGTEKELQDALLGTTPIEYGFMSAGVAKGKGFSGNILLNIYAPRGTKMMYAEPFSYYGHDKNGNSNRMNGRKWDGKTKQPSFGGESEIILQQGTKFRVTRVEKSYGQIYIDIEVIDQLELQRWIG